MDNESVITEFDEPDLYQILNIPKSASPTDIYKAYHYFSRLFHPDKNENDVASTEHFQKVHEAYEILSDETKRYIYDHYGWEYLKRLKRTNVVLPKRITPQESVAIYLRQIKLEKANVEYAQLNSQNRVQIKFDLRDLFDNYLVDDTDENDTQNYYADDDEDDEPVSNEKNGEGEEGERIEEEEEHENEDKEIGYKHLRPPPQISMHSASIQHTLNVGSVRNHLVTSSTNVSIQNGVGTGSCSLRSLGPIHSDWPLVKLLNNTNLQTELGTDSDFSLLSSLRLTRTFPGRFTISGGATARLQELSLLTIGLNCNCAVSIHPKLVGKIRYSWNMNPHVRTELIWSSTNKNHFIKSAIHMNPRTHWLSFTYKRENLNGPSLSNYNQKQKPNNDHRQSPSQAEAETEPDPESSESSSDDTPNHLLLKEDLHFKMSTQVGPERLMLGFGFGGPIGKFNRLHFKIRVGLPLGVLIKFKLFRGDKTSFVIPIHLSDEVQPMAGIYGSLVPALTFLFIKHAVFNPWRQREATRLFQEQRRALADYLYKWHNSATRLQETVLKRCAHESITREMQPNRPAPPLVIRRALYGNIDPVEMPGYLGKILQEIESSPKTAAPVAAQMKPAYLNDYVDVTIALQAMVREGRLELFPATGQPNQPQQQRANQRHRGDLPGFYDPCVGLRPSLLWIRYQVGGNEDYEIFVRNDDHLVLPPPQLE